MGRLGWGASIVGGVLALALGLWFLSAPHPMFSAQQKGSLQEGGNVENGRLIFTAAHCASCHASPGQSDRSRLGGGLALASPFGTLRVPNISPDPKDGIGQWRTADLANALLTGVSPQGTHYYPGLPYTSYTHMRPGDVRDLMAYLRTLPPVSGKPPPHELPFPFNIRRIVGIWKWLYFKRTPLRPDPARGQDWSRGQYLVEAVGHCAECHSSRNLLGAVKPATRYAGGRDQEGVGFVPNITPGGLRDWTQAQWTAFFKTGQTPDLRIVGSTMAQVLADTALLPDSERRAMATYLLTLPPRPTPRP
jgi:mono/diheme cytochrome c family protein